MGKMCRGLELSHQQLRGPVSSAWCAVGDEKMSTFANFCKKCKNVEQK